MVATKNPCRARVALLWLAPVLLALTSCTPPGPRALLEGERLMKEARYGEAIEQLRKATSLLKDNAQAWNYLGLACHQAGLPREADEAYRKAVSLNPNLASARFNLGCLWLEANRPADAALQFGSYVMLEPQKLEGRLYLGVAQLRAGRSDEAEKAFRGLLAAQPGQADALNGLALAQLQRNRARDASATLGSALLAKPDYPPAVLNLAVVNHAYLKNKPLALEYYKAYLRLNPRPLFYDRAAAAASRLEAELNQLRLATNPPVTAPAATNLAPTIVTNPAPRTNVFFPVTNRPVAVVRSNLVPVARLTNAVATRTNGPPVAAVISNQPAATANVPALVLTNPASPEPPKPVVSAKTDPPSPPVPRYPYLHSAKPAAGDRQKAMNLYQVGEKALADQRWADALVNFEAATKVDPAFAEAHARLGRVAMEVGDRAKAMAAYETALALQPNLAAARFNFALALQQEGYWADAAGEFEKYYEQNPNESNGRLSLATLYLQRLNAPAKARAHYLKLLELEPQHPQAGAIREWLRRNP